MNSFFKRALALIIALLLVVPALAEETLAPEDAETLAAEGVEMLAPEGAETVLPEDAGVAETEILETVYEEIATECVDQVIEETEDAELSEEESADKAAAPLMEEAKSDNAQTDAVAEGASDEVTVAPTGDTADDVSPVIPVQKIAFAKNKKKKRSVKVMGKLDLGKAIRLTPETANTPLQWTSSNPAVAVVDSNGVVTGVAKGSVTIYAEADGNKAKVKVNVKKNNTVVFFGDSITRRGRWKSYFKNRKTVNMGIEGDSLAGMNARVGEVASVYPAKVFILGGINSLILGTCEQALNDYEILLDNVQRQLNGVQIYLLSVLPVAPHTERRYGCTNEEIIQLNQGIQKMAAQRGYVYIDIYQYFVKNGLLNPKLSADGLHPKKKAYKYFLKAIKPYV